MRTDSIVRVAHRGASVQFPENTMLAFRQAIKQGVDALEVDVHRTKDNELVIIHDSTLERTTSGYGTVHEHTLQEILQLDAGGGEKVPQLLEVVQLARESRVRLCIEIKGATPTEELAVAEAVVHSLAAIDFLHCVIITSFSSPALLRVKALQAEVATMLDPSPQDGSLTARQICSQTLKAGANCLSYDFHYLTPEIVQECRLTGLALWPWDPDDPQDLKAVLSLDVQGVMTNRPDLLNKVLHDTLL